jgi:hypothetical protein
MAQVSRRQPIQGRQILRKLRVGRLTLTPSEQDGRRVYEYQARPRSGGSWPVAS